jgi:flagellar hook-associated protein 1 FlgK
MIRGGSLAAQFAVRDELGTKAQAQLDTVARDLIERFQDSGLDATRAPGDPGLFTDTGAAFDSADEVGIAQRMTLNAAIDPNRGGALWRIRDGLGALTACEPGNSALISDLRTALTANRTPASGDFISGPRTFAVLAGDLLSEVATAKLSAQGESAYTAARLDTYEQLEAQDGVDTDQEMQNLLVIEQAYAANARVIKTVDTLINTLLDL